MARSPAVPCIDGTRGWAVEGSRWNPTQPAAQTSLLPVSRAQRAPRGTPLRGLARAQFVRSTRFPGKGSAVRSGGDAGAQDLQSPRKRVSLPFARVGRVSPSHLMCGLRPATLGRLLLRRCEFTPGISVQDREFRQ
jgi:hypothetical protein